MSAGFRRDPASGALIATDAAERSLLERIRRLEGQITALTEALARLTAQRADPFTEESRHVHPG